VILRGLACCNRVRLIKELDGKDWRLLVDCGPPRVKALEAWEKRTSAAQAGYGSVSYSTAEALPQDRVLTQTLKPVLLLSHGLLSLRENSKRRHQRQGQLPLNQFLIALSKLEGEACGIPHLAKNERDVGHPAIVDGIGHKSAGPVLTQALSP
jgi:hypothetical protein